jgi:hypothetical protein
MSIVVGSDSTYDSSVVFKYDIFNTRNSWKGAPTINLLTNPSPTSDSGYVAAGGLGDAVSFDGTKQAVKWQRNSYDVWGAYFYNNTLFNGTLTSGASYTASFEWYQENEYPINTGTFNWELVDGPGANYVGSSQIIPNSIYIGGGWYRFSYTFTAASSGVNAYFRVIVNDRGTLKTNFWWRNLQLQQNSFRTEFIDGTRSNSQSLLDLTGRSTVTMNNMVYNSNETFSFNGSNSYINVPGFKNTYDFSTPYTISAWLNPTNSNSVDILSTYTPDFNDGVWLELNSVSNQIRFTARQNSTDIFNLFSSEVIGTGTWKHIVATYDAVTAKIYIDGVQATPTASASTLFSIARTDLDIGRMNDTLGRYIAGNIGLVTIYNRALTNAEVLSEFNAVRSRYGI